MRIIKNSVMLLLVLPLASFAQGENVSNIDTVENYSLTVKVGQLRNEKGVVQFSLYNKDETIPDKKYDKYFKQLKAEITDGISLVTFTELPEGHYAVNILHDENQNEKVDKRFFKPVEGIGFTNFQSLSLMNRPNFTKASFELKVDTTMTVKVNYL